ncbi:hypothetical protein BLOT_014237 [Blomia tropicalis]|nr:hypothetical protein BLOT_014237 [Blomia tropicalis]
MNERTSQGKHKLHRNVATLSFSSSSSTSSSSSSLSDLVESTNESRIPLGIQTVQCSNQFNII